MKQFPSDIRFKYNWRKYQSRVLSELEDHLGDNHLHIIAPPGSGKTVLGLEVAIRLNRPTLILTPTIAIKNQWIQRFCELFLQVDNMPEWISRDINDPKFLTVATYQGLHASFSKKDISGVTDETEQQSVTNILNKLKKQDIGTIVVDEAHHLKNAWWESLTIVKNSLNTTIVGLTATPPYDVSYPEWKRYLELNGPVDAEISVPELVIEENLCPHQDFVFLSKPTEEESIKITDYRNRIELLFNELKKDQTLIEAFGKHPIFLSPESNLDWIYGNLSYYSATLIFLNSVGKKITRNHLEIIGDHEFVVPKLTYEWLEILLTFYIYDDSQNFSNYQNHQKKLISKLKRNGAMERRNISLMHSAKVNKFLSSSISKLNSIAQIVDFESNNLKAKLRLVVLTDYIRKEFLVKTSENKLALNKIGVLPIFEKLRRNNHQKLGVLTGSLIIIPKSAFTAFKKECFKLDIDNIIMSPLDYDDNYIIIKANVTVKHHIIHIVTTIFEEGHIQVLIGTKSLLGEGWDAPSINALILASFVGSYVLSNQMRGRAIRSHLHDKYKTGHIWHMACIDTTSPDGGDDIELLKRRFKSFVGVSMEQKPNIESGIDRLGIPYKIENQKDIDRSNKKMFFEAENRGVLKEKWAQALKKGTILIEEVKVPFPKEENYHKTKSLYYTRTIKNLLATLGSGLLMFFFEVLEGLGKIGKHMQSSEAWWHFIVFISLLGILIFGRLSFKTFRLFVKYRDISKDIHQIGIALLKSLIKIGAIQSEQTKLKVITNIDKQGAIYCRLEGGTTYEKSTFIKSIQELIGVVDNPRYIIIRKSFFVKIFSQKDYHSVPESIGRKKSFASFFHEKWNQYVGKSLLVYTRTIEGRKLLLKSRVHSLASEFEEKTQRVSKWR